MAESPAPTAASVPAVPGRPQKSRQRTLALGLFLTLVGLVLVAVLLPTAPGSLGTILPVAAAGLVLLWVGGILLGRGSHA